VVLCVCVCVRVHVCVRMLYFCVAFSVILTSFVRFEVCFVVISCLKVADLIRREVGDLTVRRVKLCFCEITDFLF